MTCGAGCENVSSTALRLTSRPVRHLSVTSSTLPVRAGVQRQSLSYLAANFTFGSHAGVLMNRATVSCLHHRFTPNSGVTGAFALFGFLRG